MNTPETKPEIYRPILIEGVLQYENGSAVHEGYWDGQWKSCRADIDGNLGALKILNVTSWIYMPNTLSELFTQTK